MLTILVTGAGRGLGLEFTRQYAAAGARVIACCRNPAGATQLAQVAQESGGRVTVHALDIVDHASIERVAREFDKTPIDVLINNAGIGGNQRFGQSDYEAWLQVFRVNTLGPMKMAEAFVKHVAASSEKKIVTLTSVMGSIAQNNTGGHYGYRSTKAAANAVVKCLALDLNRHAIIAVAVHPGWVRTDMGGPSASIDAPTSIAAMRKLIAGLTRAQSGRFVNYDGTELPW